MGMSLNRVQIIGNLVRDPEMRQIPGGQTVTTFTIATSYTWTDQSGQKQEKSEFHDIVAWRKLAEICGEYLKKGSKVFAEGRLQTRSWEGEDGQKRYKTETILENMIMLDKKGDGGGSGSYSAAPREARSVADKKSDAMVENPEGAKAPVGAGADEEITIEDLPF